MLNQPQQAFPDPSEDSSNTRQNELGTEPTPESETAVDDEVDDMSQSPVTSAMDKEFFGTAEDICLTPEIERATKIVANHIRQDWPGCVIYGHKRTGRSSFCKYLHRSISALTGGSTLSFHWISLKADERSDVDYLKTRIRQAGFDGYNHNSRAILITRLKDYIEDKAAECGARRILFILDEAQLTSEAQMGFIGDVANELSNSYRVFVLLVGQYELHKLAEEYKSEEARNIASRYFQLKEPFHGIRLEDLAATWNSLDSCSGESAVARHFPTLAASGWTLGNAAAVAINALNSMREEMGIVHEMRLSMECVRTMANSILYRMDSIRANPLSSITEKSFRQWLRKTDYSAIMHRYQVEMRK